MKNVSIGTYWEELNTTAKNEEIVAMILKNIHKY